MDPMPDSPQSPPLDYASPSSNPKRRTTPLAWALAAVFTALTMFLAIGSLAPMGRYSRPAGNRVQCSFRLRQMGQTMQLYANDHQGRYPDTMGELLEEGLTPAMFVCPSSSDSPPTGATTQAMAVNVHAGGHLSYLYLGKGLTGTPPPTMILAYEPLANHQNQGMNVLFGDGHVTFITPPAAMTMLAELKAGHNPPRVKTPGP